MQNKQREEIRQYLIDISEWQDQEILEQEGNEMETLPSTIVKLPQDHIKKETEQVQNIEYIFDYKHPYISIQFKKPKTMQGYQESEFRSDLSYNLGQYIFKGNRFLYPTNIDIFGRILQKYPDGIKYNKYTTAFIMAAGECFEDMEKRAENLQWLRQITIENVEEFTDEVGHKLKYPIDLNGEMKPFKNQFVGLMYTTSMMPFALLWEMGTGKTRTAIETFVYYRRKGKVDKCLVICPLSVMDNWEQEIEKWSHCTSEVLRGNKDTKLELLQNDMADFVIMNYESVRIMEEPLHQWVDSATMIIADESTKVKNPDAKRSKALIKLGFLTKYKIIMTGTPVTQHAHDLFTPFLFLDSGETFGLRYDSFIDKYFMRDGYRLRPYTNSLKQISDRMYTKSLRFLKKDCLDLPDKIYVERYVQLPEYNQQKYDEMVRYAITKIENSDRVTAAIILVQLLRLSQITSGFVVDVGLNEVNFTENPKLDALEDILEETEGKVIIWTRFQQDVKNILALCSKLELEAVSIWGEIPEQERSRNVKKFQEDEETRVIVGTPQTGGLGINLTAASTVIYYSNSYSLQDRLQSEDRTHRAGQTNKVTYIDILAKNTIDVGIRKILKEKKNIADIVTKDNLRMLLT